MDRRPVHGGVGNGGGVGCASVITVVTNQRHNTGHLEPHIGELVVSTCQSSHSNNSVVNRHSPSQTRPEVEDHRPGLDAPHPSFSRGMTGAVTAARSRQTDSSW